MRTVSQSKFCTNFLRLKNSAGISERNRSRNSGKNISRLSGKNLYKSWCESWVEFLKETSKELREANALKESRKIFIEKSWAKFLEHLGRNLRKNLRRNPRRYIGEIQGGLLGEFTGEIFGVILEIIPGGILEKSQEQSLEES